MFLKLLLFLFKKIMNSNSKQQQMEKEDVEEGEELNDSRELTICLKLRKRDFE